MFPFADFAGGAALGPGKKLECDFDLKNMQHNLDGSYMSFCMPLNISTLRYIEKQMHGLF